MIIESLVLDAVRLLQQNRPAQEVQGKYGFEAHAEAVKRLQSQPLMTVQQFFAKQEADTREFFRCRSNNGEKSPRVSQQDHNHIVGSIFDSVQAGIKPAVRYMLESYSREQNRAPEWAERVAAQKHPKKMGKTLAANKDHPVLQELKEGRMLSQTHKSTLQNATYSGLAELLFSGSRNVRSLRAMRQQIEAILLEQAQGRQELKDVRAELAKVKADATRANARLDIAEQWKGYAVELYSDGQSYAIIAKTVGKSKSTVNDYILSLIGAGKLAARLR